MSGRPHSSLRICGDGRPWQPGQSDGTHRYLTELVRHLRPEANGGVPGRLPGHRGSAGPLPEVVGEAAAGLNPDDLQGLVAEAQRLPSDPEYRQRRQQQGRQQAARFCWSHTARRTLEFPPGGQRTGRP